jgi:hypothetical protein
LSISDDADPDVLIARLAGPLRPADRPAFRDAAEAALAQVPCWGEGAIYRAVALLQRNFFTPPDDHRATWDITHERHTSKLISREPIEHDHDRRSTRKVRLGAR